MGVAFVFLIYVALVSLFALPAAGLGAIAGRYVSRRHPNLKRRFMIAGGLVPIGAGAYVIACIVVMALFGLSTGRDFGFGDDFDLPLQNGYHWSAIDEPVSACVYPGTSEDTSYSCRLPNTSPTRFMDVLSLQQHGDWLAGSYDSRESHFLYPEQQRSDRWFLFNTKTHEHYDAPNDQALAKLTSEHGFALKLESSSDFYNNRRYRLPDAGMLLLLMAPIVVTGFWLYRKARRLMREATGPDAVIQSN